MNSQEYYDWLSKFEKRTTSDDTFTPPAVYDVVLDYVHNHVVNLDNLNVVRPFYPNGDYQAVEYGKNDIVIDNPPFSIITPICKWYQEQGVKFFLFAPAMTTFSPSRKVNGLTHIIAPVSINYDNGANVATSFITNVTPHIKAKTAPNLYKALKAAQQPKASLPQYQYPYNVLMINDLQKLARKGVDFEIPANQCRMISQLDNQKTYKKALFGSGLLISDNKAKERIAKEQMPELTKHAQVWELSEREQAIIRGLDGANDERI